MSDNTECTIMYYNVGVFKYGTVILESEVKVHG